MLCRSGNGLCGLVAATVCEAEKVVMSDIDSKALKLIRHNVALNNGNFRGLKVQLLDWASNADFKVLLEDHPSVAESGGFDCIIASDIIYEARSIASMWCCVSKLLAPEAKTSYQRNKGIFILAYEGRDPLNRPLCY